MVELHLCDLWSIKGNCVIYLGLLQQVFFVYEQEFRLRIDEALDQPGAGYSVHLTSLRVIQIIVTSGAAGGCELMTL